MDAEVGNTVQWWNGAEAVMAGQGWNQELKWKR